MAERGGGGWVEGRERERRYGRGTREEAEAWSRAELGSRVPYMLTQLPACPCLPWGVGGEVLCHWKTRLIGALL
eukprot:1964801-Rhodomonas_salina.1